MERRRINYVRSYEMVLIIRPDLEGDELDDVIAEVGDLIKRNDGEVTKVEPWGLHKLAYPIKDQQEGRYVLTTFELEPGNVGELERALRLRESVIRHMVIRLES
ncbi:MAG: 30S ribosomal protein S6 [Anaerolineae bacterium]